MLIFVPFLASSTNVGLRQHWRKNQNEAKSAHWAVLAACAGMRPATGRVDLVFRPRLGKGVRRRDTSNNSINAKHLEDGLVAAGILPDDREAFVRRVTLEPAEIDREGETGTYIEIIPVGQESTARASHDAE